MQGVLLVLEDVEDGKEGRQVECLLDPLREAQEAQLYEVAAGAATCTKSEQPER